MLGDLELTREAPGRWEEVAGNLAQLARETEALQAKTAAGQGATDLSVVTQSEASVTANQQLTLCFPLSSSSRKLPRQKCGLFGDSSIVPLVRGCLHGYAQRRW